MAVEVPYNHPIFTVRLKNLEIDCFVGRTVEITDGQVYDWENELRGDVFHVSFFCKHSIFWSVCSVNTVYFISPDGESVHAVEMGLLDAADVDFFVCFVLFCFLVAILGTVEVSFVALLLHRNARCEAFDDR